MYKEHMNKSAAMTIRIIRIVGRSIHPLSTTEIARRAKTDYSRAYKILLALEAEDILARCEAHGLDWCPTDGLAELAGNTTTELIGHMIELTEDTP